MYFVKNDFDLKNILKTSKNYLLSSLVMFFVCEMIGRYIQNNTVSAIVQILLGVATYGICLLILKDKFVFEFMNRARNKIKAK